ELTPDPLAGRRVASVLAHLLRPAARFDAVLRELVVEAATRDPEDLGGDLLVFVLRLGGAEDDLLLRLLHSRAEGYAPHLLRPAGAVDHLRQELGVEGAPAPEEHRLLHHVAELANVPRPVIAVEEALGLGGDDLDRLLVVLAELAHELGGEERDVLDALA